MARALRCLGAGLALLALPAMAACEHDSPAQLQRAGSQGAGQTAGAPAGERVTVTGVMTGEGVECPVLRGDDGKLYALLGDIGDVREGDRVEVTGRVAEMSFCMQGTPLEVASIERR